MARSDNRNDFCKLYYTPLMHSSYRFLKPIMDKRKIFFTSLFLLLIFGIATYFLRQSILDISRSYPESNSVTKQDTVPKDTVHFGVISRFPANVLYQGYQPLMDYLTQSSEYYFELIISRSYEETVQQLADGEVDAAFLGSYIYVTSRDKYGLKPILKPLNENGEPFFHSVMITREDSGIDSIGSLSGKRLALPSEQSFSGNWLPKTGLNEHNLSVSDLQQVDYFQHHHTVVYEIMRDNFDAGAVKDRVAHEFSDRGVNIVARSNPVPGSPIVVSTDYNKDKISAISEALLRIDPDDPFFAEKIKEWDPEFAYGFTEAVDEDYDVIAERLNQMQIP